MGGRLVCVLRTGDFLWPVVLIALVVIKKLMLPIATRLLALIVVAWCAYLIKVGGGFMEFRMLVPILPLAFVLLVATCLSLPSKKWGWLIVTITLTGSVHHMTRYRTSHEIAPIVTLATAAFSWEFIGRSLKTHFHGATPPVIIATTAAGAIPFYSELPTVDMHGLNDRYIARHGEPWIATPGHWRLASHRYLLDKNVNLVTGHPLFQTQEDKGIPADLDIGMRGFRVLAVEPELTSGRIAIIELPIDDKHKVPILYLKAHPKIDAAITQYGLNVYYLPVLGKN